MPDHGTQNTTMDTSCLNDITLLSTLTPPTDSLQAIALVHLR